MAWTEITRPQYRRVSRRYASDLTDDEWKLLALFMPEPSLLGRPRTIDLQDVVDALLYMASTGCQWRQLPKDARGRAEARHAKPQGLPRPGA